MAQTIRHLHLELLVLRAQAGESEALGHLVEEFQPALLRHARHLTHDEDAAWDMTQECWAIIVRTLSKLNDAAAFPAWALRIVSNRCRDWIRHRRRERHAQERAAVEVSYARAEGAPGEHEALLRAIENLPGEQRALLNLHYAEGFSVSELAGIFEVPEGTVKSRLHNLRGTLRRTLEKSDE